MVYTKKIWANNNGQWVTVPQTQFGTGGWRSRPRPRRRWTTCPHPGCSGWTWDDQCRAYCPKCFGKLTASACLADWMPDDLDFSAPLGAADDPPAE
eukprot:12954263-Alexandrium_andersonii.AAC.1